MSLQITFKGCAFINKHQHRIKLKHGTKPICICYRRRSPNGEYLEWKLTINLIRMGVLTETFSLWSAISVFVPKKGSAAGAIQILGTSITSQNPTPI